LTGKHASWVRKNVSGSAASLCFSGSAASLCFSGSAASFRFSGPAASFCFIIAIIIIIVTISAQACSW